MQLRFPSVFLLMCLFVTAGLPFHINAGKPINRKLAVKVDALAIAIEKGDMTAMRKLTKSLKRHEDIIYESMVLFRRRRQMNPGLGRRMRSGYGMGEKPGVIQPDGIELKLRTLSRAALPIKQLAKERPALVKMGYRIWAIGHIVHETPESKLTNKKKKRWREFTSDLRERSRKFVRAVESEIPAKVLAAANKLNDGCSSCHAIFRQ